MISLVLALYMGIAQAQSVQQPECISPVGNPNAPVGAIYLHGQFPASGAGWMVNLERSNRKKLQELADQLGVRVAVPLSNEFKRNKNGKVRSWDGFGNGAKTLAGVESLSEQACGTRLGNNVRLIGFSDGAYAARRIGLSCAAKKPKYSSVTMIAGNAWRKDPAAGVEKGATCGRIIDRYPGGHELPPGVHLARILGCELHAPIPRRPPVVVPVGAVKPPPRVANVRPSASAANAEFIFVGELPARVGR